MEHKSPGVGSPAGMGSSSGNGSPAQENATPRRRRARSGKRGDQKVELTIAGVAWRPSGAGHALVVMARGQGAGQMRSSFATLTVFHGGQAFPVTAPVTVIGEGDPGGTRQTLRFMFRLPASAPSWPIEHMVLRWRGTEVELPPPAHPPNGAPGAESELFRAAADGLSGSGPEEVSSPQGATEPDPDEASEAEVPPITEGSASPLPKVDHVAETTNPAGSVSRDPPGPISGRYGPDISESEQLLTSLREEIVAAKLELAQLHADLAEARLQYEEASMAREYAQRERDRAQQWLVDVTRELEDVERQLGHCRRELDLVTRELAGRRARLADEPRAEAPSDSPPEPAPSPSPSPSPPAPSPSASPSSNAYAAAERDLNAAISQLRSKLAQVLSQPVPAELGETEMAVEEAPVGEASGAEASADHPILDEAPTDREPPETPPPPASAEEPPAAPRTPASLPGPIDREDAQSSWFATALRRLAEDDREAGGRLLVSVLPAQAIATPRTFHYDLVIRDDGVYAVDAHPLDTRVERLVEPRPMNQTDAWIVGTFEQLGELIVHGRSGFRRLFNRHGLKVKGQRARLDDLLALAAAPLRLRDLCAVGAPIQPQLLLQMIGYSIDPSWWDGRPFSIRFNPCEEGMHVCSFRIQDGSPMVLGVESTAAADFGEVTTVVEGSARSLMRLLAGLPSPEDDQAHVTGPAEPLEVLQGWVRRLELSSL